jgi:plasmid stabilization system protein ParE
VKVITTPKASRDLEEWISRIATENLPAAESFLGRIRKCIDVIRTHPLSGHKHPRRPNIRKLVEVPIIIHYEIFEDHIEILRFWHSARNPRAIRYR